MPVDPVMRSHLGDAGHKLRAFRAIYANNPDGRPFTITLHRNLWPGHWESDFDFLVHDPSGMQIVATGEIRGTQETETVDVVPPATGGKGIYAITLGEGGGSREVWFECSLEQLVVDTGDWEERKGRNETFDLYPVGMPRRWYFFVPEGTSQFRVSCQHGSAHRQDSGMVVFTPRGQPVAATYGSRPRALGSSFTERYNMTPGWDFVPENDPREVHEIETDPGSTGRFWSLWVCGGDGHCWSPQQMQLDGVPTYLAAMPEMWFNPQTGRAASTATYDFHIGPAQRTSETFCPPCPLFGDTDTGMRGRNVIHLNNTEGRTFDFCATGYIIPQDRTFPVSFEASGPDGQSLGTATGEYTHKSPPEPVAIAVPAAGTGVYQVAVEAERHWFGWSEPSMQSVLAGHPTEDGGSRFPLTVAMGRNWFFSVPAGTGDFLVRVELADPNHVLAVEVHGPDRMVQTTYAYGGAPRDIPISVPERLDGRIWFLRLSVASATRFLGQGDDNRRSVNIDPDVELHGVPGFLSPSWEQWFDPTEV